MSSDTTPTSAPTRAPTPPDPDACIGVVALVTEYLEGTLDADVRARFERHLAGCEGCEVYLQQMRATIAAAGGVDLEHVEPTVLNSLLAAYRSARGA